MYILRRVTAFVGGQYTGQTRPQKVNNFVFVRKTIEKRLEKNDKLIVIIWALFCEFIFYFRGGGLNFQRRNLERPIFQNFTIANNKITKDELFDSFFLNLFFQQFFLEII